MNIPLRTATLCLLAGSLATAGPVSTLYITDTLGHLFHVQGNSSTTTSLQTPWESAFVVSPSTIRTIGVFTTTGFSQGNNYALDGTFLDAGANNTYFSQLLDATSDGTWIYAVQWPNNSVATPKLYRFNMDWTSPTFLWDVPVADIIGVTWDASDQTLWMASRGDKSIQHYKMDGTSLGGFTLSVSPLALALDPADGTLWTNVNSDIVQYSRSGQTLSAMTITGMGYALGMEFAPASSPSDVPEPSSVLLATGGLAVSAALRRRR